MTGQRLRETEALLAVSLLLDSPADLTETVRRVAREVARSLEVDMVGVYLPDADGAWLRPVAGYRVPRHLLATFRETPFPLKGHPAVEEAQRKGQPVWTSDAGRDPRVDQEVWKRFPHRSTLLVPMLRDGALIGAIFGVWWRKRRAFPPGDLRLAAALGAHATAVLERARLREQGERRRQNAEALADVAHGISASLDPEEVSARITDSLRRLLGVKAARLWKIVPGTEALRLVASTEGEAERGLEMPPGIGISAVSMRQRLVVASPDILADPRAAYTEELRERIARLGHRAALVAPLLAKGQILGVLTASDEAGRIFSPDETSLASAFAAQAAVALDNADAHQSVIAHAERLRTLTRLNGLVSLSLRAEEVLGAIAKAAAELAGAAVATIWHAGAPERTVKLVASSDPFLGDFPIRVMSYGEGMVGWVAAHRRPLEVADVFAHERSLEHEWWRGRGLRAFLGIPVVTGDALVAVLGIGGERPFDLDGDALALLDAFAAQAAVAIRNASLFAESERRRRTAEALGALGRSLAGLLEPEAVGQRTVEGLHTLIGAVAVGVFLGDAGSGDLVLLANSEAPARWLQRLPAGTGAVGLAASQGAPVWVPDILTDDRLTLPPGAEEFSRSIGYGTLLAVPLLVGGRAIGAVGVGLPAGTVRDEETIGVVEVFAAQAAVALDNARLYREATESERLLARERHALELVAAGAPLSRVLDTLCHAVEDLCQGALCSFLMLEEDGARLRHAAAPSLPTAYCDAIDGIAIGPAAGSCGTAAYLKRPVVVADISTDPLWAQFRDLALAHGLASCWSVPVLSTSWAVLGTFAVYRRTPGEPGLPERALVDRIASLASIAIERSHEAKVRTRLLEKIISAQEEERGRIARELHDETAQSLAALALGLDGLRAGTSQAAARAGVTELHRIARQALVEVRQMAWGLRPTVLDDLGLVPGIERYAAVIQESRGLAVEVSTEGMDGVRLPRLVETALYRIAQEALSNVARHAQARSARVVLAHAGPGASLSVEDDGRGFDAAAALSHSRGGNALGIQGMRERAAMLGASLHIESTPGRGTRVLVRIPIEEEPRGQDQDPAR